MRLWLGGYTADMGGVAEGIGVLHVGSAAEQSSQGSLAFAGTAAVESSPSWLAAHPTLPVVYAALEAEASVQALRRTGDETLVRVGAPVPTGIATCHVAVAPDASMIVAAAYGDGNVAFVPLLADGSLGEPVFGAAPVDPHSGRSVSSPDAAFETLGATGFTIAATPAVAAPAAEREAAEELSAAAAALKAAVGAEFADLIPDHSTGDIDEFARFLAEQDAVLLRDDDAARAARVAAELIADAEQGVRAAPSVASAEAEPARAPHAHQARFLPNGLIATTDLGFDLVRFWRMGAGAALTPIEEQQVVLPQGSGPRHMVWHPSGHLYVVTEYSCQVFVLAPDRTGRWRIVSDARVAHEVNVGFDFPSELSMSRDATHLYTGVRGQNTIATLEVLGNGERVKPVGAEYCEGDWPRHHVLVNDTLLVAAQRSGTVSALRVDERTSRPTSARSVAPAPTPTMLLPIFD